ncbi:glycine--tRNA ligase [Methanobrevibacter filiformis]|uniref:glycine--tRNA ligase n=1 Tax=Methanobrevibacter filiformis TaxID=55758 RepID=A0A166AHE1_9EURY|nr:glycine--tRNA ligase [Methanobrevibacter filiformis]KZX12034.1 glycine--tRNA ligase [Methanobrevibacter filiformis]
MNHDKMTNISVKRGFLWPSFEIYSGVAGFTDYGPLGAILKNNIMQKWRKQYITEEGFYEIESPTVSPEEVLRASGHVNNFTDPMTQCVNCKDVFRADHIIEEQIKKEVDGLDNDDLDKLIKEEEIQCPNCGDKLTEIWNYNLMFKTKIGAKGDKIGYMRPETAQGIFIQFKRLSRFFKNKLPFGVVQLGKAYRNEISPRQGVIRLREFTQAEAEIFVNPKYKTHPKFSKIKDVEMVLNSAVTQIKNESPLTITAKEAVDKGIVANEILVYQIYLAKKFLNELGIPDKFLRFRQHMPNEMAHYALDCWDVEVKTDRYGWVEIIGIADRGDYDLLAHSKHSNEDLNIYIQYDEPKTQTKEYIKPSMNTFGPKFKQNAPAIIKKLENLNVDLVKKEIENNGKYIIKINNSSFEILATDVEFVEKTEEVKGEKITPHVIEPSFGIDRIIYAVLIHSFHEAENKEDKDYFKLKPNIAPIQVSVFPLLNKKELNEIAIKIVEELRNYGLNVDYDTSGTIGKRYARCDEIGVPIAITIDFDTLENNSVTIRNRDDETQERIDIDEIKTKIDKVMKS